MTRADEAMREAYRANAAARLMANHKQKKLNEIKLKKARKHVTTAMTQKMTGVSPANGSRFARRTKGVRYE